MIVVNMHEAKSRLSELVRLVESGEKVVLARNG
ncbi:MAG: type II toxin-antitoxin system Phd/YefM family antitoxin, partial [Actinobacteria bacterium]|nr:type II toxin-antitoxin system Phd/YefM family antitoxin [Actinomycetota bacterium]